MKELICIVCPRGCHLSVDDTAPEVTVTGNACPRGAEYAVNECLHPVRTVTTTVRVTNREDTMVSVKTRTPVAKEDMARVVALLRKLTVEAPVTVGQIVAENICGSTIVVTKNIL